VSPAIELQWTLADSRDRHKLAELQAVARPMADPTRRCKPAPGAGSRVSIRKLSAVYPLATFRPMRLKVRRPMVLTAVPIAAMPSKPVEKIQKQFGARMRVLRRLRSLSQEELAFSCNLDRTYIGSVERGERNISLINIHTIATALGVSPKEFFND